MNKALLISTVCSLAVVIFNIAVYVFLREGGFADIYAEFTVYKRTIAVISALALLGLPTAIARNTPSETDSSIKIVFRALRWSTIVLAILWIASINWGGANYQLPIAAWPYLLSLVGCTISIARLRGKLQFVEANILVTALSLSLALSIFLCDSLARAFALASCIQISLFLLSIRHFKKESEVGDPTLNRYLGIGLPRLPGDFLFQALFSLPLLCLAKFETNPTLIGDFGFTIALFNMITQVAKPVSFVYLPFLSALQSDQDKDGIRTSLIQLYLGGLVFCLAIAFAPRLGETLPFFSDFVEVLDFASDLTIASVGLGIYVMLRGVADSIYQLPMNTIVLSISFLVLCTFLFRSNNAVHGIVFAMNLAFSTLGLLTLASVTLKSRSILRSA